MDFKVFDLGLIEYNQAFNFQKEIWQGVKENKIPSSIIICEHYPVITLGRNTKKANIFVDPSQLKKNGIEVIKTDRGGDITYHGPGQLVFYPIFNLNNFRRDIAFFLRNLEEVVIRYLYELGIVAERITGLTGVWVGGKKISSIGIAIRKWTTYHGLSLNVYRPCLLNFGLIRPCGMDIEVTSLEDILGRVKRDKIKNGIVRKFGEIFKYQGEKR
ncbi:MAG: lipoyl(octanoyl) transferase LipB [Candidatus Omnitrophica bacterium]|nr:lipoyl(octanoyl) transferase LipB [Candidatus Omnitrophota bacterium]